MGEPVTCPTPCKEIENVLSIADDARGLGVFVAYTLAGGGQPGPKAEETISKEVERLLEELRRRYNLESLKNEPLVRAYRDFYWRIGIDPTKTRPSSEALVRRALRGNFPRINPLVDAGNIASARTMVPIGLYDARFYTPPVTIRLSTGGEVFEPIGGREERLPKGVPILVDSKGTVMHVYPHRDSKRTMIRSDTTCMLIVAAGVPGVPRTLVLKAVEETVKILSLFDWKSCKPVIKP